MSRSSVSVAWLVMPVHWIRDEHTYIILPISRRNSKKFLSKSSVSPFFVYAVHKFFRYTNNILQLCELYVIYLRKTLNRGHSIHITGNCLYSNYLVAISIICGNRLRWIIFHFIVTKCGCVVSKSKTIICYWWWSTRWRTFLRYLTKNIPTTMRKKYSW